jgi:hypothetical protein
MFDTLFPFNLVKIIIRYYCVRIRELLTVVGLIDKFLSHSCFSYIMSQFFLFSTRVLLAPKNKA